MMGDLLSAARSGRSGKDGRNGRNGRDGRDGRPGEPGADGKSAYQVAVARGFKGTESEWLISIRGAPGRDGLNGKDGAPGRDGRDGVDGKDGKDAALDADLLALRISNRLALENEERAASKRAPSYRFEIIRDPAGRIIEVIARPMNP